MRVRSCYPTARTDQENFGKISRKNCSTARSVEPNYPNRAMSDKLAEIIATKNLEVQALLPRAAMLRAAALQRDEFRGFRAALDCGPSRLGLIAEVKKASPSVGLIDPDFDPVRQAGRYIDGGASCLSILTDEKYFQGSLSYLTKIAEFSTVPCYARTSPSTKSRSTRR